eukprot:TRINITY_DN3938_c0_g2_i1.p1 TRINITY_DN3938_c0_g2~~TRINITY_DN3938_c0_g2_i1.p1  ORF type:complete len:367 (-),score=55.95 TRINITY_DN3938_c0_g2_i1:238-1338(-)
MTDFQRTSYGTKKLPFTEKQWKIPGYTGFVQGIQETYMKTPIQSQREVTEPPRETFLFTRTFNNFKSTPQRDPCNNQKNFQKAVPDTLWPSLQEKAIQDSAKPPRSNIMNGDLRLEPFHTLYSSVYNAPFEEQKSIRSPMRNPDLAACDNIKQHYISAYNRVGEKRLEKMIRTMAERLSAKLGNSNNNAFRMRRLFKMYDQEQSGMITIEDFRMMMESFGIQLDDDSLLALFYVYDESGQGNIEYEQLMGVLLDPDYFALYVGNVDNTLERQKSNQHDAMIRTIRGKFKSNIDEMRKVFDSLDEDQTGSLSEKDFLAGCAALGVVMNDKEYNYIIALLTRDENDYVMYEEFCSIFINSQSEYQGEQ